MAYEVLDMTRYPRRAHFAYFRDMAYPYVGVTRQTDVTELTARAKENGYPLFLTTLFYITRAANRVVPFRQRIRDGGIVQYDWCRPSYTVALADETYCYCRVDARTDSLEEFVRAGERAQALAVSQKSLDDGADGGDLLYISCMPWLAYTSLIQPTPAPADSNPRISWGRIARHDTRMQMPLTVLAHHALADGKHIAQFYEAFERAQTEN